MDTPYHYRQPNYALMEPFDVTEEDIKQNRNGNISPKQRRRIWLDRMPTLVGFTGGWLFFVVMYLAFRHESMDSSSTNVMGAMMAFTFFALVWVIVRAFRIVADLEVNVTVGIATLEKREGRYGGWFLYVDGRSFELKPKQFAALYPNMPLAVYYVDKRKRLLSVEQVIFQQPI